VRNGPKEQRLSVGDSTRLLNALRPANEQQCVICLDPMGEGHVCRLQRLGALMAGAIKGSQPRPTLVDWCRLTELADQWLVSMDHEIRAVKKFTGEDLMSDWPKYRMDPDHPHDLNEGAIRQRTVSIVPHEVPVVLTRGHDRVTIMLHDATDADLEQLNVLCGGPMAGWRWARTIARRLAGIPPLTQ
jgi:hypothetical protein